MIEDIFDGNHGALGMSSWPLSGKKVEWSCPGLSRGVITEVLRVHAAM